MKYEFSGRVRYSETDENGRLSVPALINYFQDCSTFQSDEVGEGIRQLREQHRAWILASWQIDLIRMPRLHEEVTAATWAYEFKDFYGLRNFTLTDERGNLAARANSVWVYFDVEHQRPVKVSQEVAKRYAPQEPLEMDYASRKIRIPRGQEIQKEEPFQIGRHHLDTNHHVNNGEYIRMAADYLPEGFQIAGIRAEYRKQARLNDRIIPGICRNGENVLVLLNGEDEKPYALVEFTGCREEDPEGIQQNGRTGEK